jgi:hypothetical protein
VDALAAEVPTLPKATEAQKLEEQINTVSHELDLLVETVSNLKIRTRRRPRGSSRTSPLSTQS